MTLSQNAGFGFICDIVALTLALKNRDFDFESRGFDVGFEGRGFGFGFGGSGFGFDISKPRKNLESLHYRSRRQQNRILIIK